MASVLPFEAFTTVETHAPTRRTGFAANHKNPMKKSNSNSLLSSLRRLRPLSSFLHPCFPSAILVMISPSVSGASGTWISASGGLWSDGANWTSGDVADGGGFAADFSTINGDGFIPVSLDTPRTISSLQFGDVDSSTPTEWLLNNNLDALNLLTMANAATIHVGDLGTNAFAEISCGVAGTDGIAKTGIGKLVLTGTKPYTGPTTVSAGTLTLSHSAPVGSAYSIASGAILEFNGAGIYNVAGGSFSGSGTLVKTGSYRTSLGFSTGGVVTMGLAADAMIHVKEGILEGNSFNQGSWSNNQSDALIEAGAYLDAVAGEVRLDAVNGAGQLRAGYWATPATVTLGVADGSGTLSGGFNQNTTGVVSLVKSGTGTQSIQNFANHSGPTTVNGGRLVLPQLSNSAIYSAAGGSTLEINRATNQSLNITNLLFQGGGTFVKSGPGQLAFSRYQNEATGRSYEYALSNGSQIRVEEGQLRWGDYSVTFNFANNRSGLHIATGASVEAFNCTVLVDALTGGGIYQGGNYGPRRLTVGVNDGSGTFSGTIQGNGLNGDSQVQLFKVGTGTQTFTGKCNARGGYGGSSLEVRGGTSGSPSGLILSPSDPLSTLGYASGGIYFSPAASDYSSVTQTAGTMVANLVAIGERGQSTFTLSGGVVNAGRVELAWNGGSSATGPAIMNISGPAVMNILNNGNLLLGRYGTGVRDVSVHQTGGSVIQFSNAGSTRGGTGKMQFFSRNQNVTWNLSGGLLSIADIDSIAAGTDGNGAFGGGNGILNLNGGTLQITNSAFAAPVGDANGKPLLVAKALGDMATPGSGARIDPYGLGVTFAAPIQHGGSAVHDGGVNVESSVPGGSLTLSGINTYTGNTLVAAGSSFILANNAELRFVINGSTSNKVTGAGNVIVAGKFVIDTAAASAVSGTSWVLADAASISYDPVTFSIPGFTETANVWTKAAGGAVWTFTEATGVLSYSMNTPGGYGSWISGFTPGDTTPGGDPDSDGMPNLLEYVLNGNPGASDPSILPGLEASGANFVFTFHRRTESKNDTTQTFQSNSDLGAIWADTPIPPTSSGNVVITPDSPAPGIEQVQITLPKGGNIKLFGRIQATQP